MHDEVHKKSPISIFWRLANLEIGLRQWRLADRQIGPSDPINENSTQLYTMSTHDDYHESGRMRVGDHLLEIEGSLKQ